MNNDKLNKKLKTNWKNMEFELFNEDSRFAFYNRKTFETFMRPLFERDNDKSQIDLAFNMYDTVLTYIKNIPLTTLKNYPAYNLTPILNKDLFVVFYGEQTGATETEINGKLIQILLIGNRTYKFKNNDDLYIFWTNFKSFVIHEFIHLNDYKRIKTIKKSNFDNDVEYYNNPREFNAYYLEIAYYFYNRLKHNSKLRQEILLDRNTFINELWNYIKEIQPNLKQSLTKEMLFKWNKRLYQLFDELKKEFKI